MKSNSISSSKKHRASQHNATHLPAWSKYKFFDYFIASSYFTYFKFWLIIFTTYWIIPLLISIIDLTFISKPLFLHIAHSLGIYSNNGTSIDTIILTISYNLKLTGGNNISYLNDHIHFIFALAISFGGSLLICTIKNFNITINELINNGIFNDDVNLVISYFDLYRTRAYNIIYIFISAVFGFLASLLFIGVSTSNNYLYWWGHLHNGLSGIVFIFIVGLMVTFGTYGSILLIYGSIMLAKISSTNISLKIFNHDGCNGLHVFGRQIFMLWVDAIIATFVIYLTLNIGYMGIEKSAIVILFALFGAAIIPILAFIPLFSILKSTIKDKMDY